jgi:hypothetical protein
LLMAVPCGPRNYIPRSIGRLEVLPESARFYHTSGGMRGLPPLYE